VLLPQNTKYNNNNNNKNKKTKKLRGERMPNEDAKAMAISSGNGLLVNSLGRVPRRAMTLRIRAPSAPGRIN